MKSAVTTSAIASQSIPLLLQPPPMQRHTLTRAKPLRAPEKSCIEIFSWIGPQDLIYGL